MKVKKLLQEYNEPEVFAVTDDNIKHWVQNMYTFKNRGFVWGAQEWVSLSDINNYKTGETWNDKPNTVTKRPPYYYIPTPLKKYKCRVYLNHPQTIQRRVRTKIELDKVSYNPYKMFDTSSHSIIIPEDRYYWIIVENWFDKGAVPGGVYSVVAARNDKPLSKDCLIERDDMCPAGDSRDIQPHGIDAWPLKKGDKISLWLVYYFGGPCILKTAHTQNFLTIISV